MPTVYLSLFAGAGQQFFDNNGKPLAGGKLYTYAAGTSTPTATYTTSAGTIAQANPMTLDAAGRVPAGGEIWIPASVSVKFVLKDSVGVTIQTLDNIQGGNDPANATASILATLALSSGSSLIGFIQSGTGAVARTVQAKCRDVVSVTDFGADPTGVVDATTAFTNAQGTGNRIVNIPPGTYLLDNLRVKNGVVLRGSGTNATFIKQKTTGNYAINMLSDVTVGQLIGCQVTDLRLIGATSATVAALNMEANGAFAIRDAIINVTAYSTYAPLRMNCPAAGAIFNSNITVESDVSVAAMETQGTYNVYELFTTGCAAAVAINDSSTASTFLRAVTEAGHVYGGQHNTILCPTVENWSGSVASPGANVAINNAGFNNTLIGAAIVTVPNAKCNYGFKQNATPGVWINPRILGTATTQTPNYGMNLAAGSSGMISSATLDSPTKIEAYTAGSTLQSWTFTGDCSTMTAIPTYRSSVNYVISVPLAGATITFADNQNSFIIKPLALLATLTVVMPPNPLDGTVVNVSAANAGITTLTVNANAGQFIVSAPTTLAAGSSFRMVYTAGTSTWYPV